MIGYYIGLTNLEIRQGYIIILERVCAQHIVIAVREVWYGGEVSKRELKVVKGKVVVKYKHSYANTGIYPAAAKPLPVVTNNTCCNIGKRVYPES